MQIESDIFAETWNGFPSETPELCAVQLQNKIPLIHCEILQTCRHVAFSPINVAEKMV